jgi:flagellar FliL protein
MARKEEKKDQLGKKRDWKFTVLLLVLGLLLLVAVGTGGYYLGSERHGSQALADKDPQAQSVSFAHKGALGPLVELEDFLVNISDGKQTRYLKSKMTLEALDKETKQEIQERIPQIRDAVIFHMGTKTFDQVRDLQGKKQLRAELTKRINAILEHRLIEHLFFTEFVVQ